MATERRPADRRVRLALLGCGDVAQRDYLPELHRVADRAELVAVCARTRDRVREVAEAYGIPACYTDYNRMLAESEADAVVNLTPIPLHAETNLAALEAGKHVYTEKPLAGTVAGARRLRDEARRRGLTLVCAPSVLLFPQLRRAHALLEEGAIGEVHGARGLGHGGVPPWAGYVADPTPYFAVGGGPGLDMGVYPLHALTGLLGPARRVAAMALRAVDGFTVEEGPHRGRWVPVEVPDTWHLVLAFGERCQAAVETSFSLHGTRAPQLELWGREGTLALNLLDVSAPLEILRAGRDWEQLPVPHTGRSAGPDHLLGIQHLVDCIRQGREPVLSGDHAVHVVEILEQAGRAAAESRTLELESSFAPRRLECSA